MTKAKEILKFKFERTIPARPEEVFDAWLDPKIPGNPWNAAEKFILNAAVDGLFYWTLKGTAHYGRFTRFKRPFHMEHTWMSPNTLGQESLVTVTFKKCREGTVLTLIHSGLPNHAWAKGHESGWNYFLNVLTEQFGDGSRKKFDWEEAHSSEAKKKRDK